MIAQSRRSSVRPFTPPDATTEQAGARGERPSHRRAAEQCDELAALQLRDHSMTSSARASNVGGTFRPIALAALRLITSSYLVGACTGRSAGFWLLKIRST